MTSRLPNYPVHEFDQKIDRVCAWCTPMHVMSGPHAGESVPEESVTVTRDGGTFRSVPDTYKGTLCTTGMCPRGERRFRGLVGADDLGEAEDGGTHDG